VGLEAPADILSALSGSESLRYSPDPRGLLSAREAVVRDFERRGIRTDSERLVLTSSTSEAYALLFKLLTDPGDTVLVPRPGYPLFDFLARLESVDVTPYALAWDGHWHLDRGALERSWTSRTRAVVTVNPNNPTGSYLETEERRDLEELCRERGAALISDEVFWDYPLGAVLRRAESLAIDGSCLGFSLGGISKSLALPQLKLGWIAVSGPEALRREAIARLEIVADTYLSVGTPVQLAAPSLLARAEELQRPVRERVLRNLSALLAALQPPCPASLLAPEAGWSAVLRVPATRSEEDLTVRLVEDEGVLVHPGYFFDFPGEAYLVLSLLPRPADFDLGIARLLGALLD
jgi:hypothetical protein